MKLKMLNEPGTSDLKKNSSIFKQIKTGNIYKQN